WTTAIAFLALFLVIALLISRVGRRQQLLELMKADEKPKREPKASVWLSLLGAILLLGGYGIVFFFVTQHAFYLTLLVIAIGCVTLGTWFLFSQLSVYAIHALKRREKLLFRRLNLLTLTDLAYRMRDNANMFFMVATVTAAAFCGIGVCLTIGDPHLSEGNNPYAFTYSSYAGNVKAEEHTALIDRKLEEENVPYKKAKVAFKYTSDNYKLIKLSDYNKLAKAFGYEAIALEQPQTAALIAGPYSNVVRDGGALEVALGGGLEGSLTIATPIIDKMFGSYNRTLVLQDDTYERYVETVKEGRAPRGETVIAYYMVDQWQNTLDASRELADTFDRERTMQGDVSHFSFAALALEWFDQKQMNGILIVMSVLVGVVFFTFAASFIYFRLYADLERDEKQYRMISKIGLSDSELKRLVTRQLGLMFFLPFTVAVVHSAVAFMNIQMLVKISMLGHAMSIYTCFFLMQLLYFLIIRWRYFNNMQQKLI
ncbi:MAG: hypothetical protein K0Q59_634, partial [Paenibacillus sp.]|nr:hypothetical protein [Paenibacillus sp.]